jgi:hypothetical protein
MNDVMAINFESLLTKRAFLAWHDGLITDAIAEELVQVPKRKQAAWLKENHGVDVADRPALSQNRKPKTEPEFVSEPPPVIELISRDKCLQWPAEMDRDGEVCPVLYIYPEGDCDTIKWPAPKGKKTAADWDEKLEAAIFSARETGDLPHEAVVLLPDGTVAGPQGQAPVTPAPVADAFSAAIDAAVETKPPAKPTRRKKAVKQEAPAEPAAKKSSKRKGGKTPADLSQFVEVMESGRGIRGSLFGHPFTAICRWAGANGYTVQQVAHLFERFNVPLSPATMKIQVKDAGAVRGPVPALSAHDEQIIVGIMEE